MKEITTAILFIAAAHLFCVPASDDIQARNFEPVVEVETIEVQPKTKGVIELQLADWCAPCKKFKASGIIKELEEAGWTIKYSSDIARKYPSFRLTIDGKSRVWSGYSSKSRFYSHLKTYMNELGYDNEGRKISSTT